MGYNSHRLFFLLLFILSSNCTAELIFPIYIETNIYFKKLLTKHEKRFTIYIGGKRNE